MTKLYNPALYEEPINQPMKVAPSIPRESLFGWLESTGRFRSNEIDDFQEQKLTEDLDDILDPEIYAQENEDN